MTQTSKKQAGFTIVELLIVIVVILILAALVVNTFTGIQKKARDTERTTDIKAIHGQVEAYYAQNGKYPTLANMNDSSWRSTNMKGLDAAALVDPKGASLSGNAPVTGTYVYSYQVTPASPACDNGSNGDCTGYTLTAVLEDGTNFSKTALNQGKGHI